MNFQMKKILLGQMAIALMAWFEEGTERNASVEKMGGRSLMVWRAFSHDWIVQFTPNFGLYGLCAISSYAT